MTKIVGTIETAADISYATFIEASDIAYDAFIGLCNDAYESGQIMRAWWDATGYDLAKHYLMNTLIVIAALILWIEDAYEATKPVVIDLIEKTQTQAPVYVELIEAKMAETKAYVKPKALATKDFLIQHYGNRAEYTARVLKGIDSAFCWCFQCYENI